jgi:glycosyltransferase involved in cell wall biosynthesis
MYNNNQTITLDVIMPTFRPPRQDYLSLLLNLHIPSHCNTKFFIVSDNPSYSDILQNVITKINQTTKKQVHVLVNEQNMGASFSRNRGLSESTADWLVFIDDDVKLDDGNLLDTYVDAILKSGTDEYCGFIGATYLPYPQTDRQHGLNLSGAILGFHRPRSPWSTSSTSNISWSPVDGDIWMKFQDMELSFNDTSNNHNKLLAPWGIGANLCTRRIPNVKFSTKFPLTGGGEDIEYCNQIRQLTGLPMKRLPQAKATHPYWNEGQCFLEHFWGWKFGDGAVIDVIPEHSFLNLPNLIETIFLLITFSLFQIMLLSSSSSEITMTSIFARLLLLCSTLIVTDFLTLYVQFDYHVNIAWQTLLVKSTCELATLTGHFQRRKLIQNLFWRWNYFMDVMPEAIGMYRTKAFWNWISRCCVGYVVVVSCFGS